MPAGGVCVRGVNRLRRDAPRNAPFASAGDGGDLAQRDALVGRERRQAAFVVRAPRIVALGHHPLLRIVRFQGAPCAQRAHGRLHVAVQMLRKSHADGGDSLRKIGRHRFVAGFEDGLPHRLDGIFARQHVQRVGGKPRDRRAGTAVRGLQGVLEDSPAVLQAGAENQDRAPVFAFVERGEISSPVAVDVLNFVDGDQQRPALPPAEVFGFPQQLVQRQVRLHAQLEFGAALHGASDPSECATDLPLRPLNVLGHRRRDAIENGGCKVAWRFAQLFRDQRQMRDFRFAATPFAGHRLAGELPQKAGLANALDAVDQHQPVSSCEGHPSRTPAEGSFWILFINDVLETLVKRRQFRPPPREMERTRPISAKQHHAFHYRRAAASA